MAIGNNGRTARGLDLGAVERLRAAVEQATATVTSADHAVTVTVAPGNAITELVLSSRAMRMDGATLGSTIVATIAQAAEQVTSTLADDIERITPGRSNVAALLAGRLPEPPPPPERAGPADDFTDDWAAAPAGAAVPGGPDDRLSGVETTLVGRLRAQSAQALAGYAQAREELAEQTTVVRSPDGSVTVTVLPGGAVRGIHIDDAAFRHGAGALARLVLSTIQRANAACALRVAERVQELAGPALSVLSMVESAIPPELRPDQGTGADRYPSNQYASGQYRSGQRRHDQHSR